MRPELVIDASVLLHCEKASLLDEVFALPVTWLVVDLVAEELGHPAGEELADRGMVLVECSACELAQVRELRKRKTYKGCGFNDLSAFVFARSRGLLLVTADGALRKAAKSEGLRCHGTLWLLEQLISHEMISPLRAASALEAMIEHKARLPARDCQRLIEGWRRSSGGTHTPVQQ